MNESERPERKATTKLRTHNLYQPWFSKISQSKEVITCPYILELIVYITSYMTTCEVKARIGFNRNLSIRERLHMLKK